MFAPQNYHYHYYFFTGLHLVIQLSKPYCKLCKYPPTKPHTKSHPTS